MRHILVTLAIAILGGTAVAATVENIIVRDGDRSYISGNVNGARYDSLGRHYASFELDGVRYVITDPATLDAIDEAIAPQIELGKKQAALGQKQAQLGQEQARIGMQQAAIGRQQASGRADDAELSRKQRELGKLQDELGERQAELGERQAKLGELQRETSAKIEEALEKIFRNAVRNGVARRR